MPNGGGDLHDLWDRLHEVEKTCNMCQGAKLEERVSTLEKTSSEVKSELRLMSWKVGLVVGGAVAAVNLVLGLMLK